MALLARRARRAATKAAAAPPLGVELAIPAHFRCPISLDLMRDPVTAPTGITYDREGIEAWLDTGRAACPVTHGPLRHEDLVPNHAIRRVIQDWCVANRSRGVERIPTPKIPVTPVQASELLFEVGECARAGPDAAAQCAGAVARVRALARDSERNRRCFVSIGTGRVLAAAFESLAAAGVPAGGLLEDVLAALVCMMPLDEEAPRTLGSPSSLGSLVAIAKHGSLAGRLNAVLMIKEVVSCDGAFMDLSAKVDEIVDALVKIIKAPICPQATKAAMVATYHLARSDERVAARIATTGLVPVLVEVLVDTDKSASEKALAVLDAVLASEEGRASARDHALTLPVLVKKMFRVSDLATELAVSAMWRLGKGSSDADEEDAVTRCLVEALRVGAFQKLLLLLQVGCRDATKEKATELLKMLNKHKGVGECVDAVDFRGLNRLS